TAVHVDQHQREVSTLSSRGQDTAATPIRSITERPLLFPSSFTRRIIGFSCESLSLAGKTTGLPRSAAVTVWVRPRLSAGGTSSALPVDRSRYLDRLPFGPSVSASCACPLKRRLRRFT